MIKDLCNVQSSDVTLKWDERNSVFTVTGVVSHESFCNTFTYALPTMATLAVAEWYSNRHRVLAAVFHLPAELLTPMVCTKFSVWSMHTNYNHHLTHV